MKNRLFTGSSSLPNIAGTPASSLEKCTFFALAVAGFSFWFFLVVPFASHRETYWWLAMTSTHGFAAAFSVISVTYRPLAQGVTWLAFLFLDRGSFPTSPLLQALVQLFVYAWFVAAWWLVFQATSQKRLLAIVSLAVGAVYFPGYIHLFHVYGLMYVPVVLTLGAILYFEAKGSFKTHELQLAFVALLLIVWHPFATALFAGYYFGYYLETFRARNWRQHAVAVGILLALAATVLSFALIFPRSDAKMPFATRAAGFLISYRTNEFNPMMSVVAFALTLLTVLSFTRSTQSRIAGLLAFAAIGAVFYFNGVPLLLLWIGAALIKLGYLRRWGLFFMTFGSALLPFGAGIGAPVFALFAFILAVYATVLGWEEGEQICSKLDSRYLGAVLGLAVLVLVAMRAGVNVPVMTKAATPLLAERERTYQLERLLSWLHQSSYCGYEIGFDDAGGSPLDSATSAMSRRNRPPSSLEDVRLFWNSTLRCHSDGQANAGRGMAKVTFGGALEPDSQAVFTVPGQYGGDAAVWIKDSSAANSPVLSTLSYKNHE